MGISTGEVATASDVRMFGASVVLVVTDNLRTSNDTIRSTSNTVYTKLKEIQLNESLSVCRVKFNLAFSDAGSGNGRIYRNGTATGTEQVASIAGWTTFSQDFTGNWASGDLIQLYALAAGGATSASVSNFRLYYSYQITSLTEHNSQIHSLDTDIYTLTTVSTINQDP